MPDINAPDPAKAETKEDYVTVVRERGVTAVVGNAGRDEWIRTEDMAPVDPIDYR